MNDKEIWEKTFKEVPDDLNRGGLGKLPQSYLKEKQETGKLQRIEAQISDLKKVVDKLQKELHTIKRTFSKSQRRIQNTIDTNTQQANNATQTR